MWIDTTKAGPPEIWNDDRTKSVVAGFLTEFKSENGQTLTIFDTSPAVKMVMPIIPGIDATSLICALSRDGKHIGWLRTMTAQLWLAYNVSPDDPGLEMLPEVIRRVVALMMECDDRPPCPFDFDDPSIYENGAL